MRARRTLSPRMGFGNRVTDGGQKATPGELPLRIPGDGSGCFGFFLRSAAEAAILFCGGALGDASGTPAGSAKPAGHPLARAEEAFEKRGQIEVGIQPGEMNAKALQALGILGREHDVDFRAEVKDDAAEAAVVVGAEGARLGGQTGGGAESAVDLGVGGEDFMFRHL